MMTRCGEPSMLMVFMKGCSALAGEIAILLVNVDVRWDDVC